MDIILKAIDSVTSDKQVKSIINSLNDNQEKSKNWLIEKSKEYFTFFDNPTICIAAGWYGSLASKMKEYTTGEVVSFDKDPMCKKIGKKLYKDKDIIFTDADIKYYDIKRFNIVICTSCEHLGQYLIDEFLKRRKKGSLVILQSNNYFSIKEHINCHNSVIEFEKTLKLEKILYRGTLKLDKFDRYMVIGI